jgi:hypothetical protein
MSPFKTFLGLTLLIALNYISTECRAQLTDVEKKRMLATFNEARGTTEVSASDMKMLVWDDDIAKQAQAYTDQCENIYKPLNGAWLAYWDRTNRPEPVKIAWWRTLRVAPYYDYETGGCTNETGWDTYCRHPENYEAIVLARNERIGCGMTVCRPGEPKGIFYACAVDGNRNRPRYAWTKGERCSACPAGFNYCVDGLCSKYAATSKPTQSPTTSKPTRSPTKFPTRTPSKFPTRKPTRAPTKVPTRAPSTRKPTQAPTRLPTKRQQ